MNHDLSRRQFIQHTTTTIGAATLLGGIAQAAEQASEPIGVALVGGAHIHTPDFINRLNRRNDVKTKCVWDHDAARAQKRAEALKATVVKNVEEIWQDPQIKAVVICSETTRHRDLVLAAAKAGKHMFVEKPLGSTAKESEEMASAIEQAKVLFSTGYFMRSDPKHRFLKEQVAKGSFGKITRIHGSNCHTGSLGGWFDTEWRWMADPKIAGVGGFGDLGTHSLDIMMWLIGDVEEVTADVKVVTGRYGECDEAGEGMLRFKNGTMGVLTAGWVDHADPVTLLISGTEGHAAIINGQLYFRSSKVQGADGKAPWKEMPAAWPHAFDMFVNAVTGKGEQALVTVNEAAARVKVMEAMYQGAKERKWVKVG